MITDVKINEAEKRRFYESGAWGTDTIADVWQDRSTRFTDQIGRASCRERVYHCV